MVLIYRCGRADTRSHGADSLGFGSNESLNATVRAATPTSGNGTERTNMSFLLRDGQLINNSLTLNQTVPPRHIFSVLLSSTVLLLQILLDSIFNSTLLQHDHCIRNMINI